MKWQEYQEAVGELYNRMEAMGTIKKNVLIPDKVTGQNRQIDVWWELTLSNHQINILIDAKLRTEKLDVNDVAVVAELAEAVKANKAIIVTSTGWTKPAETKASFIGLDLRIMTVEEALNLIVPNKWFMCQTCKDDCVVLDSDGVLFREKSNLFFDWYAGKCRKCNEHYVYCAECGSRVILEDSEPWKCYCSHEWKSQNGQLFIRFKYQKVFQRIDNAAKASSEFLYWMLNYPIEYWGDVLNYQTCVIGTDKGRKFTFRIQGREFIPLQYY